MSPRRFLSQQLPLLSIEYSSESFLVYCLKSKLLIHDFGSTHGEFLGSMPVIKKYLRLKFGSMKSNVCTTAYLFHHSTYKITVLEQ